MRTRTLVLAGLAAALLTTMSTRAQQPVSPDNAPVPEMPKQAIRTGKHVNRIIDMWLKGQPVYYAQIAGGGYDKGKEMRRPRPTTSPTRWSMAPSTSRNCATSCAA